METQAHKDLKDNQESKARKVNRGVKAARISWKSGYVSNLKLKLKLSPAMLLSKLFSSQIVYFRNSTTFLNRPSGSSWRQRIARTPWCHRCPRIKR